MTFSVVNTNVALVLSFDFRLCQINKLKRISS